MHVRFLVNWQWPAINMQYERLMARGRLDLERMFYEHANTVADMDFFVIMVRRFLRTADKARQIPSDNQQQLKLALKVFRSRWGNLTAVRDALEHSDSAAMFPVPAIGVPEAKDHDAEFVFMWPGGNIDVGKLFKDACSILQAIKAVIGPAQ